MKTLIVNRHNLIKARRWDIDFHLPPEGIKRYPQELLARVDAAADVAKTKRDPSKEPDKSFLYVDIASVDVTTGEIASPQELTGAEAPSRARKVVQAYDIIISTCRPTRGAIAIVPESLHGQICSTGFSVIRPKEGTNPFFLHFVLRLESTLEQFRKWSTGSSYPAILDEDIAKTSIPLPHVEVQNEIARQVRAAGKARADAIRQSKGVYESSVQQVVIALENGDTAFTANVECEDEAIFTASEVKARCEQLGPVEEEAFCDDVDEGLFAEVDEEEPTEVT